MRHSIRGHLDAFQDGRVKGWALRDESASDPVELEILVDGNVVARDIANRHRGDLERAAIGNGNCAFLARIPTGRWRDGESHELSVRVRGTEMELPGSPLTFTLSAATSEPADVEDDEAPRMERQLQMFAADTVLDRRGTLDELRRSLSGSGRLALMATYQEPGSAPSYLIHYLHALRALDIAVVVIDTTPGGVRIPDGLVPVVIHRENVGWDFASWLAGIDHVREVLGDVNELLLVNDSVFGPISDLREVWANPRVRGADFWGLTDSWAMSYHLQSYFLVLGRPAFSSEALWSFARKYPFPTDKTTVVEHGEVGLTSALNRAGFTSAVLCPYDEVARTWLDDLPARFDRLRAYPEEALLGRGGLEQAQLTMDLGPGLRQTIETARQVRRGASLNPTHFFWDTLIECYGLPFIKRDLLQVNRPGIPIATEAARVLGSKGYDIEHVRDAARRARDVRVATV